jgi:hypothetical protein
MSLKQDTDLRSSTDKKYTGHTDNTKVASVSSYISEKIILPIKLKIGQAAFKYMSEKAHKEVTKDLKNK